MVQRGPTNITLAKLISGLEQTAKKNKAPIWKRAAELLSRPTRKRVEVNLVKLGKLTGQVLVPGKVLSVGIGSKATIAAFSFSSKAREKIAKTGGKTISIKQLIEMNPTGKNVKIII